MTSSFNHPTTYSALGSIGVHLIFCMIAGSFYLSQDRPVPPRKKTIKLEVVNKIPPLKKESIRETVRQRIETSSPIENKDLPKIQKPLEILEMTPTKREVPAVEQMALNPVQTPPVATKQLPAQTERPLHTVPVAPRNIPSVQIPQSNNSARKEAVYERATRLTQPAPKRRVLQPDIQSTSAKNRFSSTTSRAVRAPLTTPVQKHFQAQSTSTPAASTAGQLINSRAQRFNNNALVQAKAIQSDTAPKEGSSNKGSPLQETSASRVSLSDITPKKPGEAKSTSTPATSKRGQLINRQAQRVDTALLQTKAVQSNSAPKEGSSNKGSPLQESSASRVSLPDTTPKKPGEVKSNSKKGTLKTALFSPDAKRFASQVAEPRPVPNIIDPKVLQGYSRGIQRKISSRKKYPKRAKRTGKEGQLTVRFTVLKSGEIEDLILVTKTPYEELNKAGLNAVKRAAPFPSLPEEIGEDYLVLELPFKFEIK